jgi:hypothetical protein
MFIVLDKEWYRPGDRVEGRVYFELFTHSYQTELSIRLEGKEQFPKRQYNRVFEEVLMSDKKLV